MDTDIIPSEEALGICAWCGAPISEDAPVVGLGGKKRPGVDLSPWQGHAIRITLATQERTLITLVASEDSDARKQGQASNRLEALKGNRKRPA